MSEDDKGAMVSPDHFIAFMQIMNLSGGGPGITEALAKAVSATSQEALQSWVAVCAAIRDTRPGAAPDDARGHGKMPNWATR